jgi:uncharacterized radical SAM superfamily Fe-S cluster-containing enzyme
MKSVVEQRVNTVVLSYDGNMTNNNDNNNKNNILCVDINEFGT